MPPWELRQWDQIAQDQLQELSDLLHLFHHRNRNQHSHSIWWRHYSIFRRQLDKLVREIASLNDIPMTNLARARKKRSDVTTLQMIKSRITFWHSTLLARWVRAFSQLIADGRFAVLGLVLLAVLAQVSSITGLIACMEEQRQAEIENALNVFAREDWGLDDTLVTRPGSSIEDLGEAVQRSLAAEPALSSTAPAHAFSDGKPPQSSAGKIDNKSEEGETSTRPSKRSKRKNAIDDLFG